MMAWIKYTDRMPPDMEPVIVTAFHRGFVVDAEPGEKFVSHDVRWNEKLQAWEVQEWNICEMEWTTWHDLEITHWMSMPRPAED